MSTRRSRRFLAPEVVQTSAMDCGPASLKCLLEGHGIPVSYGRLREACQTDVDGTSIDTMEEIAVQLGLDAEQVMIPADHLLLTESGALPAIVVVRQPNGLTHFVVAWGSRAGLVQLMDPATGRRWTSEAGLMSELYIHTMTVPADAWREYAGGTEFTAALRARLDAIGVDGDDARRFIDEAGADIGPRSLATLDAALRMVDSVVRSGGLRRGREAVSAMEAIIESAMEESFDDASVIPAHYWSIRSAPTDEEGAPQLTMRGAVLVRVRGPRAIDDRAEIPAPLSPDLVVALEETPVHPLRRLLSLLREDGLFSPLLLVAAFLIGAGGVVVEALLFRGVFGIGRYLPAAEQRIAAAVAVALFIALLLLMELPTTAGLLRLGRHLEVRLRAAFLAKIPRLGDRYFRSRPISDMAERSHTIHQLRQLPELGGGLLRTTFQLLFTAAGLVWLDPALAPAVVVGVVIIVTLPLLFQPLLSERDLRARVHVGALGRFYLDALLGLTAIRAHGAERAVRREHESLLVEWVRAGLGLQRTVVLLETLGSIVGMGLAALLLLSHLDRSGAEASALLVAYWGLQLPVLGQSLALLLRQYPTHRNVTLRLLEPLGAPEEYEGEVDGRREVGTSAVGGALAITLRDVRVVAAGHTILDDLNLTIEPGSHVAIVGRSGAGKSSLVGILLGWHRPTGTVLVDGEPLDERRIAMLRRETAWIDPSVQLWNRSLLYNLRYGAASESYDAVGRALTDADLRGVLERFPDGLQTPLGESGGFISGGEGQRVRLGRAMLRPDARLVVLDEPFRGLDHAKRREMLARARALWRNATLICVTHDVGDTLGFDRVLVVDGGRVVEDDSPATLAAQQSSLFRSLLDDETHVRRRLWSRGIWRRLWLDRGRLIERMKESEEIDE